MLRLYLPLTNLCEIRSGPLRKVHEDLSLKILLATVLELLEHLLFIRL